MLRIFTTDGREIDVRPDLDIEFEMENPIFQSDYIPVTFSTTIQLPPSRNNVAIFGYLAAQKQEPRVKDLAVSLVLDGIELMSGTLSYEGITESGDLEYTFSGRNLETEWGKKIYELGVSGDYTRTISSEMVAVESIVRFNDKVPVVGISNLLKAIGVEPSVLLFINDVYLLGTYLDAPSDKPCEALPDRTAFEFVKAVAKMFCCAVFPSGSKYEMIGMNYIIDRGPELDWETKVSDRFASGRLLKKGYRFSFVNSYETTDAEMQAQAKSSEEITTVAKFEQIINLASTSEYKVFRVVDSGQNLYSIKKKVQKAVYGTIGKNDSVTITYNILIADIIADRCKKSMHTTAGDDEIDSSSEFSVVTCVPAYPLMDVSDEGEVKSMFVEQICPVVKTFIPGSERPSEMHVGRYVRGQLIDTWVCGYTDARSTSSKPYSYESGWLVAATPFPLGTNQFLYYYHRLFASYMAMDKQVITCEVNLSVTDIASFRLWQKVRFAGRRWLVRKLIIDISSTRGITSCRGEFVECEPVLSGAGE